MAGTISEFFGYRAEDKSAAALKAAADKKCPFMGSACTKMLGRERTISGVCAIRQKRAGSPSVICCPNRIYAEDYKMLKTISKKAFGEELSLYAGRAAVAKARKEDGAIAVFGHGWGGELRLPQRQGTGSYFVWENVSKRIIPQIIYKGQVLQREELCRTGLYFVCPTPIYKRVLNRLGGKDKIPAFPTQPAAIHFVAYDYAATFAETPSGATVPLDILEEHCTTVYKVQEAFSAVSLPEGNVYGNAIRKSLYAE